ncbi:phosphonate C-P lyase system protein PhnG [Achromobacter aloeverae]|uniref:Phosphonate C-P lyase system protein PhnG n=1 Tax=Achromobacter aloeverae TaxID=1750518 RepID=A0A4V1MRC1_9BURK|nr:phosphonate C-P lyase system protein PhnG [Achromobacter aloeverae]RXN83216.1 phosphonate C-P lyase system protein PhnG [Achromobacter aloeverae]
MDTQTSENGSRAARAAWMRVLALADGAALDRAYQALGPLPAFRPLRAPEVGMTMVRGRAGGTGEQFNLGEMSVTRCAVAFDRGVVGTAYVQGRSLRHAEQAAVLDGLLQMDDWHESVRAAVIVPLARVHEERRARRAAEAAQTRVEFFTMVRGEN